MAQLTAVPPSAGHRNFIFRSYELTGDTHGNPLILTGYKSKFPNTRVVYIIYSKQSQAIPYLFAFLLQKNVCMAALREKY